MILFQYLQTRQSLVVGPNLFIQFSTVRPRLEVEVHRWTMNWNWLKMGQQVGRLLALIPTSPWHLVVSNGGVALEVAVDTQEVAKEAEMFQVRPVW